MDERGAGADRRQHRPPRPVGGRREEVLEAAAAVFYAKGYGAATIQDIADELGLLKGSLYHYISTKEDVLFEIIRDYHESTRAYFDEIDSSEEDVVARLRRFIETETAHIAGHLVRSSLFYSEWRSLSPDRREVIVAERDRHDRFVRRCVVEAQAAGRFRADVEPRLAALGVLGMVGSVYRWYDPQGPRTGEDVGRQFADLIIGGLALPER